MSCMLHCQALYVTYEVMSSAIPCCVTYNTHTFTTWILCSWPLDTSQSMNTYLQKYDHILTLPEKGVSMGKKLFQSFWDVSEVRERIFSLLSLPLKLTPTLLSIQIDGKIVQGRERYWSSNLSPIYHAQPKHLTRQEVIRDNVMCLYHRIVPCLGVLESQLVLQDNTHAPHNLQVNYVLRILFMPHTEISTFHDNCKHSQHREQLLAQAEKSISPIWKLLPWLTTAVRQFNIWQEDSF